MQERRWHHRYPVCKPARLVGPDYAGVCTVCDLSAMGARLALEATAAVPDRVTLSLDNGRTVRCCRVAWRTAGQMGVEFQDEALQHTSALPITADQSTDWSARAIRRTRIRALHHQLRAEDSAF
jgi:hypothetical protein